MVPSARCAWFIVEFPKGNGPEESRRIDRDIGATMVDIYYAYKTAQRRAYAEDAVAPDEKGSLGSSSSLSEWM